MTPTSLIVRRVKVDRIRANSEVVRATRRNCYVEGPVLAKMPTGEGDEVEMTFFKLSRDVSDCQLEREYDLRALKADPRAQAAINEDDPAFADDNPNATHWRGADGEWCYTTFSRWKDSRNMGVYSSGGRGWDDYWFFGGVPK